MNKEKIKLSVTPKILSCQCLDDNNQPSAGLFRSRKATEKESSNPKSQLNGYRININQKYTDKTTKLDMTVLWKIDTQYALNIHDRKVFLSILHLVLNDSKRQGEPDETIETAFTNKTYYVNTTLNELSKIISDSRASSKQIKAILESLYRLARVSILRHDRPEALTTKSGKLTDQALINYSKNDSDLTIGINPYLAYSISSYFQKDISLQAFQYTILNIDEINKLKKDNSQLLHNYLSPFTNKTRAMKFSLETLRLNIYGQELDRKALYKQRKIIKESMIEIGALENWNVTENNGVYSIIRS